MTIIKGHLESDIMINKRMIATLEKYIEDHQVQFTQVSMTSYKKAKKRSLEPTAPKMAKETPPIDCFEIAAPAAIELDDYIMTNKKPPFQTVLFQYIDKTQLSDAEVYNKAFIDRRLFSKIRSNIDYHPNKTTIISLGLALSLALDDMEYLLNSAGYSLNKTSTFDLIIHFCLEQTIYSIIDVNQLLDHFDQNTL